RSSSGMTRALRMRSSVSLTCSTRTVAFANCLGRVMRALSSVVQAKVVTAASPWLVGFLLHPTALGIHLDRSLWLFWSSGMVGETTSRPAVPANPSLPQRRARPLARCYLTPSRVQSPLSSHPPGSPRYVPDDVPAHVLSSPRAACPVLVAARPLRRRPPRPARRVSR